MTGLTRRGALRAGLESVGATVALAGCTRGGPAATTVEEGFEDDSFAGQWETAAAIGPEVPIEEFDWTIERSRERSYGGAWSLRVVTEGDHDDGTAWATRMVPVRRGTAYDATVSVSAWSESESFNTLRNLVLRLGRGRPEAEADFPDPGQNTTDVRGAPYGGLREPLHLAEGWREYEFEWTTPRLEQDRLFVSLGVSVVWEADAVHFLDDLRVELTPR